MNFAKIHNWINRASNYVFWSWFLNFSHKKLEISYMEIKLLCAISLSLSEWFIVTSMNNARIRFSRNSEIPELLPPLRLFLFGPLAATSLQNKKLFSRKALFRIQFSLFTILFSSLLNNKTATKWRDSSALNIAQLFLFPENGPQFANSSPENGMGNGGVGTKFEGETDQKSREQKYLMIIFRFI